MTNSYLFATVFLLLRKEKVNQKIITVGIFYSLCQKETIYAG